MGKLGKRAVVAYIATECDRQFFWDLGKKDPTWIDPMVDPIINPRPPGYTKLLKRLGSEHEQKVYERLVTLPGKRSKRDKTGKIGTILTKAAILRALHAPLLASGTAILLEHQFSNIDPFVDFLFPPRGGTIRPRFKVESFRPDVILVRRGDPAKQYRELMDDGTVREVPAAELATRLAITIHDIKKVNPDKIGKKQFIEIFYYAYVVAFYLRFHHLDDCYFMCVDGNGIFPDRDDAEITAIASLQDYERLVIPLSWDASQRIFMATIKKMQELWQKAPCDPASIPLKTSPGCAYCSYVQDCKHRLGMDGTTPPDHWAIDLMPSTPTSIKEQLRNLGMATIGDVRTGIATASSGTNPDPIMAEKPLLQLKADALVTSARALPPSGQVHSYAIPAFTSLAVTFACEIDQAHEHVFVLAIRIDASTAPNAYYGQLFDDWWAEWEDALRNNLPPATIKQRLDMIVPEAIPIDEVATFKEAMDALGGTAGITLGSSPPIKRARFSNVWIDVSKSLDNADEEAMAKRFVTTMHAVLVVANITELRVKVEAKPGWWVGPELGIFFWGENQLDTIELMVERHLHAILADPATRPALQDLVHWITPSASEVAHPFQHKKIFDFKAFAQATMGFPCVINYTWQDIAHEFNNAFHVSPRYWVPHYDYFDYRFWHSYLDTIPMLRPAMEREIVTQMEIKMRTLNAIRFTLQAQGRQSISSHSRPVTGVDYRALPLGPNYHAIAHVWYMFSRLNGTRQEMDADFTRTTFPDRAIGKLEAARITVPHKIVDPVTKDFHYEFSIPESSSNVKMKEGDEVLAIPEEKRDLKMDQAANQWRVHIEDMTWNHATRSYDVATKGKGEKTADILAIYLAEYNQSPADTQWYLYPWANDPWSPILRKLLDVHEFGTSWLGAWLAWTWHICMDPGLAWPAAWTFGTPEIYLFAPTVLKKTGSPPSITRFDSSLKQDPDPSQKEAINRALHEVIFGIQGPPGTGKSQTITALANEFHVRRAQQHIHGTRILITAFSYAALRVLVAKILDCFDPAGNHAPISNFQLIYARSEGQDKYPDSRVIDVSHVRTTWRWQGATRTITPNKLLDERLEINCIIFTNAYILHHIAGVVSDDFAFDMIIVDEASQLPVDFIMASLQYVKKQDIPQTMTGIPAGTISAGQPVQGDFPEAKLALADDIDRDALTKLVIVGDYNQLPPVQPIKPPEKLERVLGCLFAYYVLKEQHDIPNKQLEFNYRSHVDIVEFTRLIGMYGALRPNPKPGAAFVTLTGTLANVGTPWLADVLEPSRVVCTVIHDRRYDMSVSTFEASMAADIVLAFYDMIAPATVNDEETFWTERVGIVAPHNAQGRIITRRIYDALVGSGTRHTLLPHACLMARLKSTIYSVEKFQGSDRELIVASYGISDRDQIAAEEEFIYDLNRFNVLTSRAKHKVVIVCSRDLLTYIPADRDVMTYAEKLHTYAFQYCNSAMTLLPTNEHGGIESVEFRWHDHGTPVDDTFKVTAVPVGGKLKVTFPLHPRYVPVFRGLPPSIAKVQLPSEPGMEAWEFDEKDLHAIKEFVPIRVSWLRDAITPVQPAPAKPAKKSKRGFVG